MPDHHARVVEILASYGDCVDHDQWILYDVSLEQIAAEILEELGLEDKPRSGVMVDPLTMRFGKTFEELSGDAF